MKPRFSISGDDKVLRKLSRMGDIDSDIDRVTENSMKRIQLGAFKRAPVKTGFLSSNLVAEENRKRAPDTMSGVWDLIDGTDYTIVQEYTNPNGKKFFIRNSVDEERPKFAKDLKKLPKDLYEKGRSNAGRES